MCQRHVDQRQKHACILLCSDSVDFALGVFPVFFCLPLPLSFGRQAGGGCSQAEVFSDHVLFQLVFPGFEGSEDGRYVDVVLLDVGQTVGLGAGEDFEDSLCVLVHASGPTTGGQQVSSGTSGHSPSEVQVGCAVGVVGVVVILLVTATSTPVAACTFSVRSDRAS